MRWPGVDVVLATGYGQQNEHLNYPLILCHTSSKSECEFQIYFSLYYAVR